ncbi:sterol-binding-like protein [Meredithblackwellia eburnea MCA 4105]
MSLRDLKLEESLIQSALQDPLISSPNHDSSRVFALISVLLSTPSARQTRRRLVHQMKTTYAFHVTNSEGQEVGWWVDMKKKGRVGKFEAGTKAPFKPDVSIWVMDNDLVGLATGRLNPQKLFAAKRIRVRGNIDKALNVEKILSHERERLDQAAPKAEPDPTKEKGRWAGIKAKL